MVSRFPIVSKITSLSLESKEREGDVGDLEREEEERMSVE